MTPLKNKQAGILCTRFVLHIQASNKRRDGTGHLWDGTLVERVSSFKFLGVHITEDLTWSAHTDAVLKKAQQRLFFLRCLRKFGMSPHILHSFYTCTVESILTGCITAWYGNSTNSNRKALQRVVRTAHHTVGGELPSLQDIYTRWCRRKARRIIGDFSHPKPWTVLSLLPSGRQLCSIWSRTSQLRDSFFPQTIRLLNTQNWHLQSTPLCPYHSPCTFNSTTMVYQLDLNVACTALQQNNTLPTSIPTLHLQQLCVHLCIMFVYFVFYCFIVCILHIKVYCYL